jgi:hypothetical protein
MATRWIEKVSFDDRHFMGGIRMEELPKLKEEYRQFNTAYVEIPKKQGKSELAAAIALLLTCGDAGEARRGLRLCRRPSTGKHCL